MLNEEAKNIILHGPPGTGKTYTATKLAVELCGAFVPEMDRDEAALQKAYRSLFDEGRIEFVTFHQSMSYEDFVEGLRPQTESNGAEGSTTGGFNLKVHSGVFKSFVDVITNGKDMSNSKESESRVLLGSERRVFKMSLGVISNSNDSWIFPYAMENDCVLLDVLDIDITEDRYHSNESIKNLIVRNFKNTQNIAANAWKLHQFKNELKPGDIIIASWGTKKFRAIGKVTGNYEYRDRAGKGYKHFRRVKWVWVDHMGVDVKKVLKKKIFGQHAIYEIKSEDLDINSLDNLINYDKNNESRKQKKSKYVSDSEENSKIENDDSYVLIIDEINRANISKVFGELITLLEDDKRLGMPNELKVRLPYSRDEFGIPSNLYIIGTMNTADRSIALMDTALRRRFDFHEVEPQPPLLKDISVKCGVNLVKLLTNLNEQIEYMHDREHRIGHAYFMRCSTLKSLENVMRRRVIPLLAEYFFDDWGKVATVLGDGDLKGKEQTGGFLKSVRFSKTADPDEDDDAPSLRWEVRSDKFDYTKLIGR